MYGCHSVTALQLNNCKLPIEMIVCIAEKPSVARDIAKVLGANTAHEGYMEGNGYQVTWTFGHLCTLKEPHDYTDQWKAWALSRLPRGFPRFFHTGRIPARCRISAWKM